MSVFVCIVFVSCFSLLSRNCLKQSTFEVLVAQQLGHLEFRSKLLRV